MHHQLKLFSVKRKNNKNEKNESTNPIKMSKTKSQKKKVVTKRLLSDQLD